MSSGPVETERPQPSAFRRRELRLTLTPNNRSTNVVNAGSGLPVVGGPLPSSPTAIMDLQSQVRSMDCHELARRIMSTGKHHRLPYILLDCRGYLNYMDKHVRGAVHISSDRFNRKRLRNAGSVLDLVLSNNNRWNLSGAGAGGSPGSGNGGSKYHSQHNIYTTNGLAGKYRDIIVYDEGTSDLSVDGSWANSISFVLQHLLLENRQPIYLTGGFKEFGRHYSDLCESSKGTDLIGGGSEGVGKMATTLNIPAAGSLSLGSPSSLSALPYLGSTYSPTTNSSTDWTPHQQCHESYENEPPTKVLPFLYVGNARDAGDVELLNRENIRYILSVTRPMAGQGSGGSATLNGGEFRVKVIPVSDNLAENLAPFFEDACDFIDEARKSGRSILIHCQAGISRSPTIAIAYIMKQYKLSCLEAYALVQTARRIISPNLNFMGQLVEYESKLKASCENWPSSNNGMMTEPPSSSSEPSSASSSESSSCESSIDLQMEHRRRDSSGVDEGPVFEPSN